MTGAAPRNVMLETAARFSDGQGAFRQAAFRDTLHRAVHSGGPVAAVAALGLTAPLGLSGNPSDGLPAIVAAVTMAISQSLHKHMDIGRADLASGQSTLRARAAGMVGRAEILAGSAIGGSIGVGIGALADEHAKLLCAVVGMVVGAGLSPIADPKKPKTRRLG